MAEKNRLKIAFFDAKEYDRDFFDAANKDFEYKLKYFTDRLSPETTSLAAGADIVCAFVNDDLSRPVLEQLYEHKIKMIALRCAGYNNVDLSYAMDKFPVVRVPAYSPYAVAEHAAALILTLNRKTHRAYYRVRDNNFSINGLLGFDMHGKTVGVIGTGKIGKIFIDIMRGFGTKIIAYDPFPDKDYAAKNGFEYKSLDELYQASDVISLHCPLHDSTWHIVNKDSINKMKRGVMLVNTSRGHLVDTSALIAGLKSGKIGSAALDVYEEESEYFFNDYSNSFIMDDILARLTSFNNVLITSHQGFFTREALSNIAGTTLNNIREFEDNKPLLNEICYLCDGTYCPKHGKKCTRKEKP
jgi:D-lactate dehydrogenase